MEKTTIQTLHEMKTRGEPISMITAYDYPTALMVEAAGVDSVLVGDSVGMVVHGLDNTLAVSMDMMIMHCQAVRRGIERAFLVGDLPFMSYQTSLVDAKRNAGRLLAEGGVDAVKLEGGFHMVETVRALVEIGIAVMGHIGLTPQSVSALDGFRVQGKTVETARRLLAEARALEEAGAFGIVLEAVPASLAKMISHSVTIPTVGIGAGADCDGQVLVVHDMLGLYDRFTPRFVRQFANLNIDIQDAVAAYHEAVKSRTFPSKEHSFPMSDDILETLLGENHPDWQR